MSEERVSKCYILLREDLGMPQGKFSVQVGHGLDQVWGAYLNNKERYRREDNEEVMMAVSHFEHWHSEGRRKIVLKLKDQTHMDAVKEKLKAENESHLGIDVYDIFDYGFNFFNGLTQTGLIIYPNREEIKAVKRLQCW